MTAFPRNPQPRTTGDRARISNSGRPGSTSTALTVMRAGFLRRAGLFSFLLIAAGIALGADGDPAVAPAWTATDETSTQFIVTGICLFIGAAFANSPITRWLIPFIVASCGGLVYCGYVESWSVADFINGFYAGAASTGIYEATKGRRPRPVQENGEPKI